MECALKNLLKSLLLVCFLSVWSAGAASHKALGVNEATAFYTDMMPDDLDAVIPLGKPYRSNRGATLTFVTVDGDTQLKARALYNLLYILGLTNAKVYAGDPNPEGNDVDYTRIYRESEHMAFLRALADLPLRSPLKLEDYRPATMRFFREHPHPNLVLLANPLSFTKVMDELDAVEFNDPFAMGLWKQNADGTWMTAYNTNVNLKSTAAFLQWCKRRKLTLNHVKSDIVTNLGEISMAISEPRAAVFANPAHGRALPALLEGMQLYRGFLGSRLFQTYGPLAGFLALWDPKSEAWLQDPITVSLAFYPNLVTEHVRRKVRIDLSQMQALGAAVLEDVDGVSVNEIRAFDQKTLASIMTRSYEGDVVSQGFSPEQATSFSGEVPIAVIGKSSNDDMIMLRMFLGLGDRLKYFAAESTQSPLVAALVQRVVTGHGRADIAVRAGVGHNASQLATIKSLKLEQTLLEKELLARGVIEGPELASLMAQDPAQLSAEASLIEFLQRYQQVDLVVTTTLVTLRNVLSRHPELARKLRSVHLMGGWRGSHLVDGPLWEWANGDVTRNWAAEAQAAFECLGLLKKAAVKSYVYSSHLAGGSWTRADIPQTVAALEDATQFPIGRETEQLRKNWNEGLAGIVPGFDIANNYGPPLAPLMGARVALGPQGDELFPAVAGDFNFDPSTGKISFKANAESSLFLVKEITEQRSLDETTGYLVGQANKQLARVAAAGCASNIP